MKRVVTLFLLVLMSCIKLNAHPGIGIVMDSKGNIFYTDLVHVWKIAPNGTRSIAVKNVHTHELYIDSQDNLYGEHEWYEGEATDKWGNYVWRLSKDGVLEKTIPDVEGFLDNNTLVRDLKGNTYWSEKSGKYRKLKIQNANGKKSVFTEHLFNDIRWMYFSRYNNTLYIVDGLVVKKVSSRGKVTVVAKNLKESSTIFARVSDRHYVYGIWTSKDREVYVAVYGAKKVKKIHSNGTISTVFKSPRGWAPSGGLLSPDGSLWVMEFSLRNKTRIRKIAPDGKHTLYGG